MRQVEGVDDHEAPGAVVVLHTSVKPFNTPDNALQMRQIFFHRQRMGILRFCERAISVRLRQMHERPNFSRLRIADVTAEQGINQGRLPHAGCSLDE